VETHAPNMPNHDTNASMLLALGIGFIVCDDSYHILSASSRAGQLLGIGDGELPGTILTDICLPLAESEAALAAVFAGTLPYLVVEQINIEQPYEGLRYVSLVVFAYHAGLRGGLMVIISDVTLQSAQQQRLQQQHHELLLLHEQIKFQQEQLITTNQALVARSQRIADMLAIATHNLAAPLRLITTETDLLEKADTWQTIRAARTSIDTISQQARHVERTLATLFDLQRIDSAKPKDFYLLSLKLLTSQLRHSFMNQAAQAGVRLRYELATEPCMVFGDWDMLQQALAHLLSRAIEVTHFGGTVIVRFHQISAIPHAHRTALSLSQAADSNEWCVVEVEDGGPNLGETKLAALQALLLSQPVPRLQDVPGDQLSFALIQSVTQQHRGAVILEQQPDSGTRFILYFPAKPA
jgi:signal transduction histidine kinase